MKKTALLLLSLATVLPAAGAQEDKGPDFTLNDVQGGAHALYALKGRKAVVLLFLGIECPRSRAAEPRLCDMAAKYGEKGVAFLAVNANRNESPAEIAEHAKKTGFPIPVLKDEKGRVAELYQVDVEPTAILLDGGFRVRYRGLIDDHKLEEFVRTPHLRNAIEALLGGREIGVPVTVAAGCSLKKDGAAPKTGDVTYAKHVAPILNRSCVTCHRPGQVGLFSLESYEQASAWSREIMARTKSRVMPPWKAATNAGAYHNERRLADGEIATLERWHQGGAPQGDPKDAPKPPKFSDEWALGKPDAVLKGDAGYELESRGRDEYRCYVIPNPFSEDRWIAGIDYRPGNMRAVHHLATFLDRSGLSEKKDAEDPAPGFRAGGTSPGIPTSGMLGGWVPGNMPRMLPPGVGRLWRKDERILLHTHYHKTGRLEKDAGTQIALYFARGPVRPAVLQPIQTTRISIPAGADRHRIAATWTLPKDARVLDVWPHMHLIGREMSVTATLPDGSKRDLVVVKDWSFEWQETYQFKEPLRLPAGTRIEVEGIFDNSSRNPSNPSNPPREVRWGEQTTDEMCAAAVSLISDK